MLIIGIDENGLGPLLGPLVVTAVAFETPKYDREAFYRIARQHLHADDSKKVFSRTRLKAAEAATLSWLDVFGVAPLTHAELVEQICRPIPLRLLCGRDVPEYCRPSSIPLPVWSSSFPQDNAKLGRSALISAGFAPAAVSVLSVCPGAFNAATAAPDMNKFRFDFYLMMELARDLTRDFAGDVLCLCGKVGSTKRYGRWLDRQGLGKHSIEEESREISSYKVDEIGHISFIKDADDLHLPVAVASMIGKYIRELHMFEVNGLLAEPGMRPASGYRDRVTADFVEKTITRRIEIGLQDECFRRNS